MLSSFSGDGLSYHRRGFIAVADTRANRLVGSYRFNRTARKGRVENDQLRILIGSGWQRPFTGLDATR